MAPPIDLSVVPAEHLLREVAALARRALEVFAASKEGVPPVRDLMVKRVTDLLDAAIWAQGALTATASAYASSSRSERRSTRHTT